LAFLSSSRLPMRRVFKVKVAQMEKKRFSAAGGDAGRKRKSSAVRHSSKMFVAGDTVPATGIYEVVHDARHRTSHEVVLLAEDLFPPCEECGSGVRFKLLRGATYIFDDEDFKEEG
jgi:hypothetical protein